MRYFIRFSYFGKAYHGWQKQPNAITVQEVLEKALSTILRTDVEVVGAGRTDTGVHAKEMFAHFDLSPLDNPEELMNSLNSLLPSDIAVQALEKVKPEAHARFDATQRTYEYWVVREKHPFFKDHAHSVRFPLDVKAMNEAAAILMEYDDFECFSKSHSDVKTFICDVRKAAWSEREELLVFTIAADRFLRNMVRAITGTLLEIGMGKRKVADMHQIIQSKNRSNAGVSVPAKGLYLTQVQYPNSIFDE
ncbi:MAG: tRNA pseudouridine(38-40) synthase TruA [Bacteroidota bacterium]